MGGMIAAASALEKLQHSESDSETEQEDSLSPEGMHVLQHAHADMCVYLLVCAGVHVHNHVHIHVGFNGMCICAWWVSLH